MSHRLADLMSGYHLVNLLGTLDREITSIACDSRRVERGGLFVAIPGTRQDGARYIPDAVRRGASAFITQAPPEDLLDLGVGINGCTQVHVEDARHALAWVSAQFYHHPSRALCVVGITGTNGKTTLTYLLESVFGQAGNSCGVIGSINYRYAGRSFPAPITTPESLDINRMMAAMRDAGVTHCFLEVSSHSLVQKRVRELNFAVAVFTNLTRDHLDYHGDLTHYREAKKKLFHECPVGQQVINLDDPVGRELVAETDRTTLTTGIEHRADVRAEGLELSDQGVRFTLKTPFGSHPIRSSLLGRHNVYNLLSAAGVGLIRGLPLETVAAGLEALRGVPGRFEKVDAGQAFTVIVDYAHTDDALFNALQAAKGFVRGRILTVFGCGGDRDPTKRGAMGRIAVEESDLTLITSDNPRTEDPLKIIEDIRAGLPSRSRESEDYLVIPDRREAIFRAIGLAQPGDLVLIAGKGHEDYQILGTETIHFDDRETAREALEKHLERRKQNG